MFNIIITGVGGQGLITLLNLIAQAALAQGYDFKSSELHGLSQRGGSVKVHIRFGSQVFSPMVALGKADLVLALETQEALAGVEFSSKQTAFLINEEQTPTMGEMVSKEEVDKNLKKISRNVKFIQASAICKKEFGKEVTAGILLLAIASYNKLLPLSSQVLTQTIKKIMPEKYWDLNIKTFELAKKYAK